MTTTAEVCAGGRMDLMQRGTNAASRHAARKGGDDPPSCMPLSRRARLRTHAPVPVPSCRPPSSRMSLCIHCPRPRPLLHMPPGGSNVGQMSRAAASASLDARMTAGQRDQLPKDAILPATPDIHAALRSCSATSCPCREPTCCRPRPRGTGSPKGVQSCARPACQGSA